ncbi:MAG: stage V sporulation protein AB [Limnochordia bacterium]
MTGSLLAAAIGFSEGLIVGSAFVALLIVLDVIPRLVHLTGTKRRIFAYQWAVIGGGFLASLVEGWPGGSLFPVVLVPFVGLFMGIFVGLLAAALTEVLNVLPIMGRRLGLQTSVRALLLALILGKVVGSFIYWLLPSIWE